MIDPERVEAHLDSLAKPPGSLGRLEELAVRLASIQGTLQPQTRPRRLIVFAGDHGVVADGVGIWPQEVTAAMLHLIAGGRACCSALAAAAGADVSLIDVGSASAPLQGSIYVDRRIARGTKSLAHGPAMTADQFWAAWMAGQAAIEAARADGMRLVALGEIGIGNTTSAACLIALGCDLEATEAVGAGAGATEETLRRKRQVVTDAVLRARGNITSDPIAAMAEVAGFEIVAMAGAIAAAAHVDMPVVLDGVVTGAAAIVAQAVDPAALETAIPSHTSAEPAHRHALARLGLKPYLDWHMRLGEGTGALLMLPMLDAAAGLCANVATLKEVAG